MSSILSSKYDVAFIDETHRHYVKYHSEQVGRVAKREISDLLIISFSPTKQKARMTFLQAKYHRANLNQSHTTFKGDFFQFELLSKRPMLINCSGNKFNFPLDILSFSCCSSVGSYGVFFIDRNKQVDLAYCTAKYLTTTSSLTSCRCSSCSELVSCFDIDTFTNSILALEIGAELTFFPNILMFVQGIIMNNNISTTTNQFINFINNSPFKGTNDPIDSTNLGGSPINILIINADERKEG
jgi:hypothetical protein